MLLMIDDATDVTDDVADVTDDVTDVIDQSLCEYQSDVLICDQLIESPVFCSVTFISWRFVMWEEPEMSRVYTSVEDCLTWMTSQ